VSIHDASIGRASVTFVLISLCVLVGGLSCPDDAPRSPVSSRTEDAGEVSVFFTGSELGALKPCGCSGGQLGGLSKRAAIFDRVPAAGRVVVDTGTLVAGTGEQDLIKFRILFEAFRLLEYDVVHLTDEDVETARTLGLSAPQNGPFTVIGASWESDRNDLPRGFVKRLFARDREVAARLLSVDARKDRPESAAELFAHPAGEYGVNILILRNADAESRRIWAESARADCLVVPSESDEPRIYSEPGERPLVFAVARLGRYVSRLRVRFPGPGTEPVLFLEDIPVEETHADDGALVNLYRQYQELVRRSELLEKHPRIPLPEGLEYVGSQTCQQCHSYEHAAWSQKAHADAFATLVRVGSDRDPECVICHVIGMDRESGFISEQKTPHLKDVGCENCHGPGSEHVRNAGWTATTEPKMSCLDCHTPEHSSGYAGNEAEYLEKIKHWREP
jgi:hypothetical protein